MGLPVLAILWPNPSFAFRDTDFVVWEKDFNSYYGRERHIQQQLIPHVLIHVLNGVNHLREVSFSSLINRI